MSPLGPPPFITIEQTKCFVEKLFLCFVYIRFWLWYNTFMEKFVTLKKVKRIRKHGFMHRMASHAGQLVLKRRRAKGRKSLTIASNA